MRARARDRVRRPVQGALVLLVAAAALGVLAPAVGAQEGERAAAAAPSARDAHAAAQAAVLARAADLIVGIDRVGDGFVRPISGPISSYFGWRNISVGGNRFHGGLDIAADMGTPVMAARGGIVARAGWGGVYGYHVVLDHGAGWESRYAHLSRIDVAVGERLRQGAVLGLVGSTGASTGPHLHFEIRYEGRALDPLAYLGR
jgi:murein DD-endopeptidase MepM/ murein hydrolase activator NlpD